MDREVEDGDTLDFGGGAMVGAVPGHTDGSIAVHLPGPGLLFTGGAVAKVGRTLEADTAVFGHGDPVVHGAAAALRAAPPRHGEGGQPLGRRVQTTVISPETEPSSRWMVMATGNSGRLPASSSATTSAAGRPRVAVAVTGPRASFL